MIFSNTASKENVSLILNSNNIFTATSHKLLEVMMDETLKFDVHISKVCTKVLQSIGVPCTVIRRVS